MRTDQETRRYHCIFCDQTVDAAAGSSDRLDPCALILVANYGDDASRELTQEFYCHLACFRSRMGQPANLYICDLNPGDQA